jgi:tetratricopeptide (TPR) repeat protein
VRRPKLAAVYVALLALVLSPVLVAQEASESYEREAKKDFNQGRFKQAAVKYELASAAASDTQRRARMHLGEAWAHFNARSPKDARDALRSVFLLNADLEVVSDFYSADFMKLVEEVRSSVRGAAAAAAVDVVETIKMAKARLRDGLADEVIHDLTYNVPPDKLGKDGSEVLATALEMKGRVAEAARVRSAAGVDAAQAPPKTALPVPTPPPSAAVARAAATPAPTPGPAVVPFRPTPAPTDYIAMGRQALQRGDVPNALAAANRQIEVEPSSSDAYLLLGEVQLQRGEKTMAEALFRQSLKYNERNEATLLVLYDFYSGEKNWPGAIDALKRAVEVNPGNRDRMIALGRRLRADGSLDRAERVFAAASEALPTDAPVLTEYAAILLGERKTDAALEPLMRAVSAAPEREVVHANLAIVLRSKNQFRDAEREYREALRCDPDYVPALLGLGTLQLQRQLPAEAIDPLRRAASLDPRNADALWLLARAERLSARAKEAGETLERAIELGTPEIWNEAGLHAAEQGRLAEAALAFARAAEKAPGVAAYRTSRDRAVAAAAFLRDAGTAPSR